MYLEIVFSIKLERVLFKYESEHIYEEVGWNRRLVVMEALVCIALRYVCVQVTSIDTRMIFSGTIVFSMKLKKSVVSLKYESCSLAIGWSRLSTTDDIRSVGPSQPDMIGLPTG